MFKKILILSAVFVFLTIPTLADEPDIHASSAVLAMADGEQILFDKNPSERTYPGGLTKLMTALVVYDRCGMDEIVTVPDNISDYITPLEQSVNLKSGEEISTGSLINAIIVGSANDAAIALAIYCGGTVESFVDMMNSRAVSLGLKDTVFTNPTGNHDEMQYTTASDMLVIYKEICEISLLSNVVESTNVKIDATNKSQARTLWTTNSLATGFYTSRYLYPYAKGGKISSSSAGGYSIVTGAVKGNSRFIAVVMNSILDEGVNYSFVDAKKLFEYGFNNFTLRNIVRQDSIMHEIKVKNAKGTDRALLFANNPLRCFVLEDDAESVTETKKIPEDIAAPVSKGEIIGSIDYTYRNRFVGTVQLAAGDAVEFNRVKYIGNSILWFFSLRFVKLFIFIIVSAIIVYVGVIAAIVAKAHKKNKRRKRRRKS